MLSASSRSRWVRSAGHWRAVCPRSQRLVTCGALGEPLRLGATHGRHQPMKSFTHRSPPRRRRSSLRPRVAQNAPKPVSPRRLHQESRRPFRPASTANHDGQLSAGRARRPSSSASSSRRKAALQQKVQATLPAARHQQGRAAEPRRVPAAHRRPSSTVADSASRRSRGSTPTMTARSAPTSIARRELAKFNKRRRQPRRHRHAGRNPGRPTARNRRPLARAAREPKDDSSPGSSVRPRVSWLR